MSYSLPLPGEDFSLRIIFKLDGARPLYWATTHEFSTNTGGSSANIDTFVGHAIAFHQLLLLTPYQIDRAVVSTLAEDGDPYDPETFKVYPSGAFGSRPLDGEDAYDLNIALLISRNVGFGRLGHMMLRGLLTEGDLTSIGGVVQLADRAGLDAELQSAIGGSSHFHDYLSGDSPADVQLYQIRPGTLDNEERPISGYSVQRATSKKLNNKYFRKS